MMGVYYIMIITVKLHSGGNRRNHFTMLGWAVLLMDTLLPTIMEFPRAIQMTSRTALKRFPKR